MAVTSMAATSTAVPTTFPTTFQDAKDSFYLALRDRLAALNADRTAVVRAATRPAVLVAENEMERGGGGDAGRDAAVLPRDTFVLRWGAVAVDGSEGMPLEHALCEISVATAGSPELAGMDRGRVLQAMRGELHAMLEPARTVKRSYDGAAPVAAATPVFWSAVREERVTESAGEVRLVCAVEVFAWREP